MNTILKKIFLTNNPIIGMVHLKPLMGYKDFVSLEDVATSALRDASTLEKGGVDGIMIENNYDIPHSIKVGPETISALTYVGQRVKKSVKLPIGICVLWNDYQAALAVAKVVGAKFIRVPAFVDDVKTQYGEVYSNPRDVIQYRRRIRAEEVALFADIQVKHAELISKRSITKSAELAILNKADGLIVTGQWTGDAPKLDKLKAVRRCVGSFPVLVGSGATKDNIKTLSSYIDGVIVGTAIKTGEMQDKEREVNLKDYHQRVDLEKTKKFIEIAKKVFKG